jgi:hypothetical protein
LYISIIMSTTELLEIINKLPANKQKEVEDFVALLITDVEPAIAGALNSNLKADFKANDEPEQPKSKREFGSLKGFVKYIADDFDAPLEEFKDYM